MAQRRTAAEIIAFHFSSDIADIRDTRYQPTRFTSPAVYVVGNDYYAAPSSNAAPKYDVGKPWRPIATYYGRTIFVSEAQT